MTSEPLGLVRYTLFAISAILVGLEGQNRELIPGRLGGEGAHPSPAILYSLAVSCVVPLAVILVGQELMAELACRGLRLGFELGLTNCQVSITMETLPTDEPRMKRHILPAFCSSSKAARGVKLLMDLKMSDEVVTHL